VKKLALAAALALCSICWSGSGSAQPFNPFIPSSGSATIPPNTSLNLGTGTLTATSGYFSTQLQDTQTINTATYTGSARNIINQTYLTPTATNSFIWENDDSFVEQSGAYTEQGETNLFHGYFQLDAGSTAWQMENFEASTEILGTVSGGPGITSFLSQPVNGAAGTINAVTGTNYNLENFNTTAGSITQYQAIQISAMQGGGALPTNYFAILNYDSHAEIATAGGISIGSIQSNAATAGLLYIQGPDTSNSTYPLTVKNSNLNPLFSVSDTGTILIANGSGSFAVGATCTGTPTSSFATNNGIVTHC